MAKKRRCPRKGMTTKVLRMDRAVTTSLREGQQERIRFWELDALRGIAALIIVSAHVELGPWFWSWSMMDMFFILSSFLLTRIVYKQCSDWRGVLSFYGRRIERIWPLYMLTIVGLLLVTLVLNARHGVTTFDLSVFVRLFTFSQYSEMLFQPVPNSHYLYYARHLWSLAVEEQFYVLLPFAILLLRRLPKALWLSVVLAIIAFAIIRRADDANFYVLTSHADGFALGSLMAVSLPLLQAHRRPASWALGLMAGTGLLCFIPYLLAGYTAYAAGGPIFDYLAGPATASTLFWAGSIGLLALHRGAGLLAPLRWPVLVHIGHLSYAIYLVHFPILRLLPLPLMARMPGLSELSAKLLCLPLIFLLAELLYRLIDRPVQQMQPFRVAPRTKPIHAQP